MSPRTTRNSPKRRTAALLPEDDLALVRLPLVLDVFPVSRSAWWAGIKRGIYPKPYRLGARSSAWRAGEIRALLMAVAGDAA